MDKKISILMPTYNDEKYIVSAIESVINQTYSNWELIIVDDGSTDDTTSRIQSFLVDKRITYIRQENADQLNALLRAAEEITGDFVLPLHSDDMLGDASVFHTFVEAFRSEPGIDGLYADYLTMDGDGNPGKILPVPDELCKESILCGLILRRGSNEIGDTFVITAEAFSRFVRPNYLLDNTVYYIDYSNNDVARLRKIRPWYRYRVFEGNYANSDIGKFVVINGCARTVMKILRAGIKPSPNFLTILGSRSLRMFPRQWLKTKIVYPIDFIFIESYFRKWAHDINSSNFPPLAVKQLNRIADSAAARAQSRLECPLQINDEIWPQYYDGKDARLFYKDWMVGKRNPLYEAMLSDKYDHICVPNEKVRARVARAQHFLSLMFKITVEDKG